MEPRHTGRQGEFRDPHEVPVDDSLAMSLQRIERTPQQTSTTVSTARLHSLTERICEAPLRELFDSHDGTSRDGARRLS
jgi:hypothetical protein